MTVEGVSPEAEKRLLEYDWPGNVRELANFMERVVVLGREGIVKHTDLAFLGWHADERPSLEKHRGLTLHEIERDHIRRTLEQFQGRKSETAQALGIDRKTLREKIKRYEL